MRTARDGYLALKFLEASDTSTREVIFDESTKPRILLNIDMLLLPIMK